MKLTQQAKQLANRVSETITGAHSRDVRPVLTDKGMAKYGRKLQDGCIALRVEIVVNPNAGDLGRMVLFVPVKKDALNVAPDLTFASVMKHIADSVNYRASMIGRVRERMGARQ